MSWMPGLRYLSEANTTYIVDYFHNGAGYAPGAMDAYFDLIDRGYEAWTVSDDARALTLAARATDAGYGRMNPMRNYLYGRVNQPDALGVVYLTCGASTIVNIDDGSFSLLPEVQYKPTENLELRWLANFHGGGSWTEFGEKPADVRVELWALLVLIPTRRSERNDVARVRQTPAGRPICERQMAARF